MNKLFTFIVCFMVFVPLGADIAILIQYEKANPNWWNHIGLIAVAVFVVFTNGFSSPRR